MGSSIAEVIRRVLLVTALGAALLPATGADAANFRLKRVGVFNQPVYATSPPRDGRLFVVERLGRVRIVKRGRLLRRPFVDLSRSMRFRSKRNVTADQGGLLSIAFAPDHARTGLLYAFYTHRDGTVRVEEMRSSGDRVEPGSRRTVLSVPRRSPTDIGGQVQFGPDGLLYVGFGYGAKPADSQDPAKLEGKVVRLDPRPLAPPPELFASGLRVPWRFSFDRRTGALAIGDVGAGRAEEIDLLPRGTRPGVNFGWPLVEGHRGRRRPARYVAPVLTYPHRGGRCGIVGGYVVRDRSLQRLYGRYLYADVCTGRIRSVRLRRPRAVRDRPEPARRGFFVSFGEDARGRVHAIDIRGPVYRLTAPR